MLKNLKVNERIYYNFPLINKGSPFSTAYYKLLCKSRIIFLKQYDRIIAEILFKNTYSKQTITISSVPNIEC